MECDKPVSAYLVDFLCFLHDTVQIVSDAINILINTVPFWSEKKENITIFCFKWKERKKYFGVEEKGRDVSNRNPTPKATSHWKCKPRRYHLGYSYIPITRTGKGNRNGFELIRVSSYRDFEEKTKKHLIKEILCLHVFYCTITIRTTHFYLSSKELSKVNLSQST